MTPESECAVGRSALEQLARFFEDFPHEVAIKPLAVEQWLRAPLGNDVVIGGRLDRLDRGHAHAPADSLLITDYKTGSAASILPPTWLTIAERRSTRS